MGVVFYLYLSHSFILSMQVDILETPIEYLKGVGPKRGEILRKEANIKTYYDLLSYYPFRYMDKSRFTPIAEITSDAVYIQIKGKVIKQELIGNGRAARLVITLQDSSGCIDLVWFQGINWVKDKFPSGSEWIAFGKPAVFKGRYNIPHPEMEDIASYFSQPADPLHPIYNTTEKMKAHGLTTRNISKLTKSALLQCQGIINETLPANLIKSLKLTDRNSALQTIHFPLNAEALEKARFRLKFEELFFIQLKLFQYKNIRLTKYKGLEFPVIGDLFNSFYANYLPFELTSAQKRVIKEIRGDLGSGNQMNRLLQGDVGSGKTLVALMCMLMALDNGYQACLMAPTEILATQHYNTICRFLQDMPVSIDLLTGSTKQNKRKQMLPSLQDGALQILIGTHALIEDNVKFKSLGLVVIDEQHRFGVEQRAKLWNKSTDIPHILVMTATPIPRTLAMTVYGDLDISVINELPPGRKPVKTYHFWEKDRAKVYNFIKTKIAEGRQVYVVYPLIEESETLDLKNLQEGFDQLKQIFPNPTYNLSMVHGRMKPGEKDNEMQRFKNGETHIMVATTVIEVGVDVPNASVMVIENAERFGLSQLHQLRGRVGRGADQSHCILLSSYKLSADGKKRIEAMVRTTDGFEISNIDLRLRGPGDLEGTKQSGILDLKLADIVKDEALIKLARLHAQQIIATDPTLAQEQNKRLHQQLIFLNKSQKGWSMIS